MKLKYLKHFLTLTVGGVGAQVGSESVTGLPESKVYIRFIRFPFVFTHAGLSSGDGKLHGLTQDVRMHKPSE